MKKYFLTSKISEPKDELRALGKILGPQVVRSLRELKSSLKVWKKSFPHEWRVVSERGKILWHSQPDEVLPSINFFYLLDSSPEESRYVIKHEYRVPA